ncbi:MAG TPA: phage protease [Terriglobia bacterium]|nr:phage protease [Terriglobia bacterium]
MVKREELKESLAALRVSPLPRAMPVLLAGPGARLQDTDRATAEFEIPIAVTGAWIKGDHSFSITQQDLGDMVRNFEKRRNHAVVIDYEHASEMPEVAKGGPVPAAGWIHDLRVGAQHSQTGSNHRTLYARVEWTPEAEEMIRSGEYRFFSPAIDWAAADKESGKSQGATLTSGALTNHPFLEELPPIMLSDGTVVTSPAVREITPGVSEAKRDGGPGEEQEEKGMKKLGLKPIPEGSEHAGHHAVYEHGSEDPLGFIAHDELSEYAAKHLGVNPDALEDTGENRSAERDDSTSLKGESRDAHRRSFFLREAVRKGRIDNQRASELAENGKITLADYIRAREAEKLIESAISDGRILPRDRAFFFYDALERPKEFQEYVRSAPPVVRLGVKGIGSGEALPVDEEINLGVKRLMSEKGLDYASALKEFLAANRALGDQYRHKHFRQTPIESSAC